MESVDNIKENFPENPIPTIHGDPKLEKKTVAHSSLNINSA